MVNKVSFLAFVSVILASSEWLDTILLEKAAQIKNQIYLIDLSNHYVKL